MTAAVAVPDFFAEAEAVLDLPVFLGVATSTWSSSMGSAGLEMLFVFVFFADAARVVMMEG